MRDQEIIGLWEAYQQVYSQTEEVEQLDEGFQRDPEKGEKEDRSSEAIPGQAPRKMPPRGHKDREAFEKWYAKNVREDFDLFDYLLEYLVAEGYADTNKAALAIMSNMSEEWKQSIVEEVLDEELTGPRAERAREIMATASKGKAKALNRVLKSREGSTAPGGQPSANIIGDGNPQKLPTKRGGGGIKGRAKVTTIGGSKTDQRRGNRATERGGGEVENTRYDESFDLYDIILSHLLDEGYADTNKAALAIMANMSEEWKQDIMEISDKRVMAARNALAKRTDRSVGRGDGNQYSRNVSREAGMNARIQSRNQRTGSNVEPTDTRRHQ